MKQHISLLLAPPSFTRTREGAGNMHVKDDNTSGAAAGV